jgi:hypothetical protein
MRYLPLAFAILLSLFVMPSVGWTAPTIKIQNVTANCPGPTITITMDPATAGFFLAGPGNGLYVFVDGVPPSIYWSPSGAANPATFSPSTALPPGSHTVYVTNLNNMSPPQAHSTFAVPNCPKGNGMTWKLNSANSTSGIVDVGCSQSPLCDAYNGDTLCTTKLPMLCINPFGPAGLPLPVPPNVDNSIVYHKWSGGIVATTPAVAASTFNFTADANTYCQTQFGPNWRVAEFHDGRGGSGWNFQAYGGVGQPSKRFWVDINDQPATCWKH